MSLFDRIFQKTGGFEAGPDCVSAPLSGEAIPLEEIPDEVFSQGILGKGCGIEPAGETVCAPFDGEIVQVADTGHAIGLVNASGIELLIHVGLDSVAMNDEGFKPLARTGDKVTAGRPLLRFSLAKIKAAGLRATTAVVITNADDYADVLFSGAGTKKRGERLLRVVFKG